MNSPTNNAQSLLQQGTAAGDNAHGIIHCQLPLLDAHKNNQRTIQTQSQSREVGSSTWHLANTPPWWKVHHFTIQESNSPKHTTDSTLLSNTHKHTQNKYTNTQTHKHTNTQTYIHTYITDRQRSFTRMFSNRGTCLRHSNQPPIHPQGPAAQASSSSRSSQ